MKTKKSSYTPRPWIVCGNVRNGHTDFVLPCADDKDFQANCRLVSAAPDLLEALEKVSKMLEISEVYLDFNGGEGVFDAARAAIAKAKGE